MEMSVTFLLSIPIGIISGLYAGLVVARYQRFADLRLEAKKVILQIDFLWEDDHMVFPGRAEIPEFSRISSDLAYLGHKSAAKVVSEIWQDVGRHITKSQTGRFSYEAFNSKYAEWQRSIRGLSPRPWSIIKLWGGL